MKTWNIVLLIVLLNVLSGCFTVKSVDNPEDEACNLVTKELDLEFSKDVSNGLISGKTDPRGLIPLLAVVPPLSFVVSGSVTVVGNVVHWVEKKGRCNDDTVNTFTKKSNASVTKGGGEVVKTTESFAGWLKKHKNKQ